MNLPTSLIKSLNLKNYVPVIGWGYPDFAPIPEFVSQTIENTDSRKISAQTWLEIAGPSVWPLFYAAAQLPVERLIALTPDKMLEDILRYFNNNWVFLQENQAEYDPNRPVVFPLGGSDTHPDSLLFEASDYIKLRNRIIYDQVLSVTSRSPLLVIGCDVSSMVFQHLLSELRESPPFEFGGWVICNKAEDRDVMLWDRLNFEVIQGPISGLLREIVNLATAEIPYSTPADQNDVLGKPPYKYLNFYERNESKLFFGRKEEERNLINDILAHRLVVLAGPSGAGKTSLVNAGLLSWSDEPGSNHLGIYARCGEDPITTISKALSDQTGIRVEAGMHIIELLKNIRDELQKIPLIVLDQGEELFTQIGDELRKDFFQLVFECMIASPLIARFVISLRDDYLPRLADANEWIPNILQNLFYLPELTRDQAIDALLGPAELAGIKFSREIAEAIVDDIDKIGIKIAPPQIQIVASSLYDSRDGNVIDKNIYMKLGGTESILRSYLSKELNRLKDDEKDVRKILKAMVTSEGTKDVLSLSEISKRVALDETRTHQLIMHLKDNSRLMRVVNIEDQQKFELAHEYLTHEIWKWMSEDEIMKRQIDELLIREIRSWRRYAHLRLGVDRLVLFEEKHENLSVDEEGLILLLMSAVKNKRSTQFWVDKLKEMDEAARERVSKQLFDYFSHESILQRREAAETITELSENTIIETLRSGEDFYRKAALEIIGGLELESAVDGVILLLNDRNTKIQKLACGALGEIGGIKATKALVSLAKNSRLYIKSTAIEAMGKTYTREMVSIVKTNLVSSIPQLVKAAEKVILRCKGPKLIHTLLLNQKLPKSTRHRIWNLIHNHSFKFSLSIQFILKELPETDIESAIAYLRHHESVSDDILEEWEEDDNELIREFAKEELDYVIKRRKEDAEILDKAEKSLKNVGFSVWLKNFAPHTDNEDGWIIAEYIADKIKSNIFKVDLLCELLNHALPEVKVIALHALFSINIAIPKIEYLLKECLQHKDPTVVYLACVCAGKHNAFSLRELVGKLITNDQKPNWHFPSIGLKVMNAAEYALDMLQPKSKVWRKSFQESFKANHRKA